MSIFKEPFFLLCPLYRVYFIYVLALFHAAFLLIILLFSPLSFYTNGGTKGSVFFAKIYKLFLPIVCSKHLPLGTRCLRFGIQTLPRDQLREKSAARDQFLVLAVLDDLALVQHQNPVALFDRG